MYCSTSGLLAGCATLAGERVAAGPQIHSRVACLAAFFGRLSPPGAYFINLSLAARPALAHRRARARPTDGSRVAPARCPRAPPVWQPVGGLQNSSLARVSWRPIYCWPSRHTATAWSHLVRRVSWRLAEPSSRLEPASKRWPRATTRTAGVTPAPGQPLGSAPAKAADSRRRPSPPRRRAPDSPGPRRPFEKFAPRNLLAVVFFVVVPILLDSPRFGPSGAAPSQPVGGKTRTNWVWPRQPCETCHLLRRVVRKSRLMCRQQAQNHGRPSFGSG